MPKLKTKKAAAKRFSVTKTGKVKKPNSFRRHLLTNRSSKRKRQSAVAQMLTRADEARIRALMPYA